MDLGSPKATDLSGSGSGTPMPLLVPEAHLKFGLYIFVYLTVLTSIFFTVLASVLFAFCFKIIIFLTRQHPSGWLSNVFYYYINFVCQTGRLTLLMSSM